MTTRLSLAAPVALIAVLCLPAGAQGPRGAGPDARSPGSGTLRVTVGAAWTRSPEEYANGLLREAGSRFTRDSLGAGTVRVLGGVESDTRLAAGLPEFSATLGALRTHARRSYEATPITVEYGIGSRLGVSVMVPFVTSAVRVDAVMNPLRTEANVGINPALATPSLLASNAALLTQLDAATGFLNARIASCGANPGGSGCAAVNANPAGALALAEASAAYATALGSLYGGRGNSAGALFVPLAGSAAQAAVAARLAGFRTQFSAFGAPSITATAPLGAPAPLTTDAFQAMLTDSAYGIMAHPLGSVVMRGIGDVEVGAQFTVYDSYDRAARAGGWRNRLWWRSAVGGTLRLGTGKEADAADLIALGTGDAQQDVELRSVTDIGVGTHWSLTAALRYTRQSASDASVRVPDAQGDLFPEAFRTLTVSRDLGDEQVAEFFPRWTATEAVAVAAYYGYRRKSADQYSGRIDAAVPSTSSFALFPPVLNEAGPSSEHRFGASLTYSTVASWERGQTRWPLEVSVTHFQTTRGSGPLVPKLAFDAVQLRWYWRPLGGRAGK